jgi:putative FmdB family regulatory protein
MPIYEFRCRSCRRRVSVFVRSVTADVQPRCDGCGGGELDRLVSGFAFHKSIGTIHEEFGEPPANPGLDYYKDPRNIGRWAEKRAEELGYDLPSEVSDMISAAREGELPSQITDA